MTNSLQTAVTHFLGKGVAYFATALICLVIAGSALGNSFVAGRMTVAAANNQWIPQFLGTVGQVGTFKLTKASEQDESAEDAMDQGESPINALILNTVLSTIYILLGNMRILLTLNGLAEYAFYDILTTVPLQRTELASFSQRTILLDAGLVFAPAWSAIGWLPLTADRSWLTYAWTARALPIPIEQSKRGIRNPETEFFLVRQWFNPIDNRAYSKQTPAKRKELNGLQRWGLTTPEVVEEKLRLHYGLTPTGEQIPPLALSQQPPW